MLQYWLLQAHVMFFSYAGSQTACDNNKRQLFLGFIPKWYRYLTLEYSQATSRCEVVLSGKVIDNKLWLIGLAVLDGLLRVSGVVAVAFLLYGAFRYVTSQGEPENTKAALESIQNAIIGLVIVVLAVSVVSFIGNYFGGQ